LSIVKHSGASLSLEVYEEQTLAFWYFLNLEQDLSCLDNRDKLSLLFLLIFFILLLLINLRLDLEV